MGFIVQTTKPTSEQVSSVKDGHCSIWYATGGGQADKVTAFGRGRRGFESSGGRPTSPIGSL